MAKIKIEGYKCERCGHTWVPREKGEPKVCPTVRVHIGIGQERKNNLIY